MITRRALVRAASLGLAAPWAAAAAQAGAAPQASTTAAGDAASRVAALTRGFRGTVTGYARHLETGREFALRPDDPVRTASTIKLPILCALEALVAAGTVRWDERLTLRAEDKVSGSGVLHELSPGTALPIRDVATLMIVVSDNTATNLILDRITADAVNDYLDTLGLTATRALRKVRGDGPVLAAASGWSRAGTRPENARYGIGVSTPREMVRLLERLHQGTVVSPAASRDVLGILERQQFKDGVGRRAGDLRVASKSGSLDALRSDVGIVYTARGPVAMAFTVDDMPEIDSSPDNPGSELIWQISAVVQVELTRG